MANWLLSASEKWLRPVYDTLHEQLRREPVLHAAMDERYCSQLFKLEQALAALTPDERYKKRPKQEKPVLDALLP